MVRIARHIGLGCWMLAGIFIAASPAMATCSDPAAPGVDWSGCDLTNVDLAEVNLEGVILSGAIWVDGRICAEGSTGHCDQRVMSGMGGVAYSN